MIKIEQGKILCEFYLCISGRELLYIFLFVLNVSSRLVHIIIMLICIFPNFAFFSALLLFFFSFTAISIVHCVYRKNKEMFLLFLLLPSTVCTHSFVAYVYCIAPVERSFFIPSQTKNFRQCFPSPVPPHYNQPKKRKENCFPYIFCVRARKMCI